MYKGKAIYQPAGKAGEYSAWACNFYVGCSNGCEYCYCKKGILAGAMGQDKPQLKKCFKNENHALEVFEMELKANLPELQKNGLFFCFTTDPCLKETFGLTSSAGRIAIKNHVPIKILTKRSELTEFTLFNWFWGIWKNDDFKKYVAFGFTLTGHDELEKGASTNAERIEAMRKLHEAGFKTWASIEPIIDFNNSGWMIIYSMHFCDLYKIGLESGKKYSKKSVMEFVEKVTNYLGETPIYFKDSLLKAAGISREELPANCVTRDYNMFNQSKKKQHETVLDN